LARRRELIHFVGRDGASGRAFYGKRGSPSSLKRKMLEKKSLGNEEAKD